VVEAKRSGWCGAHSRAPSAFAPLDCSASMGADRTYFELRPALAPRKSRLAFFRNGGFVRLMVKALLFLCLTTLLSAAEKSQFRLGGTILQETEVARLEAELHEPAKRSAAFVALADFCECGVRVGSTPILSGDPKLDALRDRTSEFLRREVDLATVSVLLDSEEAGVHRWGIHFWRRGMSQVIEKAGRVPLKLPVEGRTEEENAWAALMPKLRRLAGSSPCRQAAIEGLSMYSGENQEFLAGLIPRENSAYVLLRLCGIGTVQTYTEPGNDRRDARLNSELLRVLSNPDLKVRKEALGFIGFNWNSAEVCQVRFTEEIKARVNELQKSADAEDRRCATNAAEGLEKLTRLWEERDRGKTRQ
jgi:hypothetical protein